MNIKEVLYYLTDNELDQLQEYLIKAQGLFVTALPFLTEREILLQSEEYFHLVRLNAAVLAEIAERFRKTQEGGNNESSTAIEIRRVFHPKRN